MMDNTLYELCARCDHFIDSNPCYEDEPNAGYCQYLHMEDGEQGFDHDATPSGDIRTGEQWQEQRPDLFTEHADGAVGPNSIHHSQRGKAKGGER